MEKSIETIWNEGALNPKLNVVPKLNQFYDKQSLSLVETLISRMRTEVIMLIPMALFFIGIGWGMNDDFWTSFLHIPIFAFWIVLGFRQLNQMKRVQYDSNCYEYLQSVLKKSQTITRFNRMISVLSIPVILVPMLVYTGIKQQGKTIGELFGIDGLSISPLYLFALIPLLMLFAWLFFNFFARNFGSRHESRIEAILQEIEVLRT